MREKYRALGKSPAMGICAFALLISCIITAVILFGEEGNYVVQRLLYDWGVSRDSLETMAVFFSIALLLPSALLTIGLFQIMSTSYNKRVSGTGTLKGGLIATIVLYGALAIYYLTLLAENMSYYSRYGYEMPIELVFERFAPLIFMILMLGYFATLISAVNTYRDGVNGKAIRGRTSIFAVIFSCIMAMICLFMVIGMFGSGEFEYLGSIGVMALVLVVINIFVYFCVCVLTVRLEGVYTPAEEVASVIAPEPVVPVQEPAQQPEATLAEPEISTEEASEEVAEETEDMAEEIPETEQEEVPVVEPEEAPAPVADDESAAEEATEKVCSCGHKCDINASFCTNCGAKL